MTILHRRPNPVPRQTPDTTVGTGAAIRAAGVGLLVLCAPAVRLMHALVTTPPQHQPTVVEMLLSLGTVLTGISGAALLFEGPALFRPYRWPRRDDTGRYREKR